MTNNSTPQTPDECRAEQERVLKMGRKKLLTLIEAAQKAKPIDGSIVGFENPDGEIVGYRVYTGQSSAMRDCEPGWGVRSQGYYRRGFWFSTVTLPTQERIGDPLKPVPAPASAEGGVE